MSTFENNEPVSADRYRALLAEVKRLNGIAENYGLFSDATAEIARLRKLLDEAERLLSRWVDRKPDYTYEDYRDTRDFLSRQALDEPITQETP